MTASTRRLTDGPLALALRALGGPSQVRPKAARLANILRSYGRPAELDARLERLRARGHIRAIPNRAQLVVGAFDMLRFWISPAAADYYASQGISYGFHQALRFLDEPASIADPVGFFSTRDGIIGHLMQVVHGNPVYDLQLLDLFDDGLDSLEAQLESMLAQTHPRHGSISAVVEEPDYHRRLLAFVRAWRTDPTIPPMLRRNVAGHAEFALIERTFGSLTGAMAYFCALPTEWPAALEHARSTRTFPEDLARSALADQRSI